MQTSPNARQASPEDAMYANETERLNQEGMMESQGLLEKLDQHLSQLPPEAQQVFEQGFKEYPMMPEVLSVLMPEAYPYFKTVQQALTQQPQGQAPAGAPQDSAMAGGNPAPQPTAEQAQAPLMGGAQPAKATSALGIA